MDEMAWSYSNGINRYSCAEASAKGAPAVFSRPLKIIIADEHIIVRECLREVLQRHISIDIVADTGDGRIALEMCRKILPDIVIMDLILQSLDGLEVIAHIKRRWTGIRVLVLSGLVSEARAATALNAGASGYVLKHSNFGAILEALNAIQQNRNYIDGHLNMSEVLALCQNAARGHREDARGRLTSRERQILKLIAEGEKNREIADKLAISFKTVESHRMNMMQKLEAHNAADLSKWARRLGLIDE
ncbi:response regulator [Burkholderia sp. Bp8986]|uniref:response regulator n=1 Tax=Burkholderia sp. Bp8986 TaxID=2184550 RepID=UPI000F5A1805|nr:response regulator [Burkholderia sp. Bp8986]RQS41754.1 response regulator [Burkholderia sp. Bp8986]